MSSEKHFERLIGAIADYAIFMLDPDGIIVSWNSGAESIKGYPAKVIIGQHFSRFYTADERMAGVPALALKTAASVGRYEAEGLRVRADGSLFWASVVIDAVRDESGELIGFAKITRDITERKEAEQRLAETRERLFEAQKLEALGQLAGGFAHDFNNLLTTITAGAELGLRIEPNNEPIQRLLNTMLEASRHGAHLTRQLLSFARQQQLEPSYILLSDFLPRLSELLRPALRSTIELVVKPDEHLAIYTDPAQLEVALLNLAFNARDAMPDGGTLTLACRAVTLDGEPANLQGSFAEISVVDTGCGIEPSIQARVLEPFFTTKGFDGTGLGLSQVYGFARQAGGTLTIQSTPEAGTTVTILLPTCPLQGRNEPQQ